MNGRQERDLIIDRQINEKLIVSPPIFTRWYKSMIAEGKTYRTAFSYLNYVLEFMNFYTQRVRDDTFYLKVLPPDIDKYIKHISTKKVNGHITKVSDSIRSVKWSALRSFFGFVQSTKARLDNPVNHTPRPKMTDVVREEYLDETEIKSMMDSIRRRSSEKLFHRDMCIFTLGITTGLNVSSLIQINLEDVNINDGTIKIHDKDHGSHMVYIGDNMKMVLERWLKDRDLYFNTTSNALFLSSRNQRINEDTVAMMLKKYAEGIIDKRVTPHTMRHSAATAIYESTGDLYLCADFMHHKRIETTKRYTTISMQKKQQVTSLLDGMI